MTTAQVAYWQQVLFCTFIGSTGDGYRREIYDQVHAVKTGDWKGSSGGTIMAENEFVQQ